MKILTDYQGEKVRLTDERLNHILEHPEMVNMESAIEETLGKPEVLTAYLTDNPRRECNYGPASKNLV